MNNSSDADRRSAEAGNDVFKGDTDGLSDQTRATYSWCWAEFEHFCTKMGLVSLPASADTVLTFIGAVTSGSLRRRGKSRLMTGEATPASASHLDVLLCAVRHVHLSTGHASPTDDPAVRAVRKRYRSEQTETKEPKRAVPLTLDALRKCVTYQPPVELADLTKATVALLLMDTESASARTLGGLRLSDLRCDDQMVLLRVDGTWRAVACRCSPRMAHWLVPLCAACLLRRLERELANESDLLFGAWPRNKASSDLPPSSPSDSIYQMATSLPATWPALERRAGGLRWLESDEQIRAATRAGVGLALTGQLALLQLRVLLLIAFARALRFNGATRVAYQSRTRMPSGYRLLLPVSKGDQAGHGRWLNLQPAEECALCPVCALDEWLWLRQAAAAPTRGAGALICSVNRMGFRPDATLDYGSTWMRLRAVREASGAGEFSLHSMRRGFANLASTQGASLEEIRDALGHRKLDTTRIYVDAAEHGEIPAAVLRLAGGEAPPARTPARQRAPQVGYHSHSDHGCNHADGSGL